MHYLLGNLHDSEGASLESCLLAADLPNVHPQVSAAASVMTRAIFAVSVTACEKQNSPQTSLINACKTTPEHTAARSVRAISTSLRPNCLAVACSSIAGGNDSCANMLTQPMEISCAAGQNIVSPLTGEANCTTDERRLEPLRCINYVAAGSPRNAAEPEQRRAGSRKRKPTA